MKYVKASSPDQIVEVLSENKGKALAKVNGWVEDFTNRSWSPSTQVHSVAYLKRFLLVNDVELDWKRVALPKLRYLVQDKAPSKEELGKILMYAPLWLKAAIVVLATSGLSVGSPTYLKLKNAKLDFDSHVGLIEIPPEATKAKVEYYSFISSEARACLSLRLLVFFMVTRARVKCACLSLQVMHARYSPDS